MTVTIPALWLVASVLFGGTQGTVVDNSESPPEAAIRELVRSQISPEYLDEMYSETAGQVSIQFQAAIQPTLKRALSESEKQRLVLFWHRKIRELAPYERIEELLVPVIGKHLSSQEVEQVNQFYRSPAGRKLASLQSVISRESRAAGEELGRKLADAKWIQTTTDELKREIPSLFPEPEKKP